MANIFEIPDKEHHFKAYMLYSIAMIWSVVTGVIVSLGFFFLPDLWFRWLTFLIISVFTAVFNLYINSKGYTNLACWTLTVVLWLYITWPCLTAGGIQAPGIISQMSVILSAGILLGWKGGLLFGVLTMAADFGFVYLEMHGLLPELRVHHTPLTRWIGAIIPFGTIVALQYYATNHLRSSLLRMEKEIKLRRQAEDSRNLTLSQLQERVKELNAIRQVSQILQYHDVLKADVYSEIANVLCGGWQYPEKAAVKIVIGTDEYKTSGFEAGKARMSSSLRTGNGTFVGVEVVYTDEMPAMDEGPFLKEERELINTIVEMLRSALERQDSLMELNDYKYAMDMSSIVAISNVDGLYTYVNDNFCKISGYSAQELIGKNFSLLQSELGPDDNFELVQKKLAAGEHVRSEFCNKAKDGSYYWVDATIVPFLDENNEVYQYLSINADITERKLAAEKIIQSEKLLRKITGQVPGNTYMFEIDDAGNPQLLFVNKGTDRDNHQYSLEELLADSNKLQEVLHPDDKPMFIGKMLEAKSTNGPISIQYRMVINGHVRWRWMQGVSEIQENGKTIWYAATSDITPLVEYIASIEQMIFDVSHVLRRPITNLMSIAYLISESKVEEKDWKKLSEYMNKSTHEIDKFLLELNEAYSKKRKLADFNIDTDSLIDKRSTLFT